MIVDEICKEIAHADLFCADLTHLNANVMFELGYAIAKNRRVWLLLDTSMVEAHKRFEQLRILTTVGYTNYCNSKDIEQAFYREAPYSDLNSTIFEMAISSNLPQENRSKLIYLKNRHNTEASIRISKRIEESRIPLVIDDPRESSIQSLTWYGTQLFGSTGLVCHFSSPDREGAPLHNARYALVAGMARGMDIPLLMLEEGDFFIPVDYRDLLKQYSSPTHATSQLNSWLRPLEDAWHRQATTSKIYQQTLSLANELKTLNVGEYIAEKRS